MVKTENKKPLSINDFDKWTRRHTKAIYFKCNCGCGMFYRKSSISYCISIYEGFFNCCKCGAQYDYTSDNMIFEYIKKPIQLSLFD